MNIYYTAKDIEDLVAKGVRQLEIGPNASLTDFARETAEQLDLELVVLSSQADRAEPPRAVPAKEAGFSQTYNKPRGCQPNLIGSNAVRTQQPSLPLNSDDPGQSTTVNRLVDMMGKIIKRGD
jgi:hypothetical protein